MSRRSTTPGGMTRHGAKFKSSRAVATNEGRPRAVVTRRARRIATTGARDVRRFLAQRLRALRQEQRLSQEALGQRSGLSGKFIGEVERKKKSISVASLSAVARALKVPLAMLTDVPRDWQEVPSEDAQKLLALLVHRSILELRQARAVLTAVLRRRDLRR